MILAGPKGWVFIARGRQGGVVIPQHGLPIICLEMCVVRCATFIQPRIRLAVVGVILPFAISISHWTNQANFIAIVDGGRARHCHLHRHSAFEPLDGEGPIVFGVLIECGIILRGIRIKHEESAVCIVAIEEV